MAGNKWYKNFNTSQILRELWVSGTTSRIELAGKLELNKSTVSRIVEELMDIGLFAEISEGSSGPKGGRKPVHLELNRKFGSVLGLEIRPESFSATVVDPSGDIVFSYREEAEITVLNIVTKTAVILRYLQEKTKQYGFRLLGMGLGISGIVNSKDGIIMKSIPLGIASPMPYVSMLTTELNFQEFPVVIDNDANCCALGELVFHRKMPMRNFLFVLVEFHKNTRKMFYENTSVGLGFVIEGKLYSGSHNSAGEVRSLFIEPEEPGQWRASNRKNINYDKDIVELREFVTELAKHIALLINTLNLDYVFFGGDIEKHRETVMPIVKEEINNNWLYGNKVNCNIGFSSLGDNLVANGAAGLVLERLFADPETFGLNPNISAYEYGKNMVLSAL